MLRYTTISKISYWEGLPPEGMGNDLDNPSHPSQLYAITRYVDPSWSFLDIGCANGWTYLAMKNAGMKCIYKGYKGVDIIEKLIAFDKKTYPEVEWDVQDGACLAEEDKSWDVAFAKGVLDYLPSFKIGLEEMCRVARKMVIVWFWHGTITGESIHKRMILGNTLYPDYHNRYSREDILKAVPQGWTVEAFVTEIPDLKSGSTYLVIKKV